MTTELDFGLSQIAMIACAIDSRASGRADGFQRLRRGDGLQHGRRVCQTHVLAGMRNDSPRDQPRIDACIQQPRDHAMAASASLPRRLLQNAESMS